MGQLKSRQCPICQGDNGGKWGCGPCTSLIGVHRELLRNLQAWHSLYEALEVSDILVASDGRSYCLWDIDVFYERRSLLPDQMRLGIELCLYGNVLERDAAVMLGLSANSTPSVYATAGITRLLALAWEGDLAGYRLVDVRRQREDPHNLLDPSREDVA